MEHDSSSVIEASVGVFVATASEAGGLLDLMQDVASVKSGRIAFHCGRLTLEVNDTREHRVCVVAVGGVGAVAAVEATQLLVETFRTKCVIVAGFAGGLRKIDGGVYCVTRVIDGCETSSAGSPRVLNLASADALPTATLVTVSRVVQTPQEKTSLAARYDADLVDMETFAVAEWCQNRRVPLVALRILFDSVNEEIGDETVRLMKASQKSTARLVGSLARVLFTKPSAFSTLYTLKERALVASDKLARAVSSLAFEVAVGFCFEPPQ